jgi:hypothetical protein
MKIDCLHWFNHPFLFLRVRNHSKPSSSRFLAPAFSPQQPQHSQHSLVVQQTTVFPPSQPLSACVRNNFGFEARYLDSSNTFKPVTIKGRQNSKGETPVLFNGYTDTVWIPEQRLGKTEAQNARNYGVSLFPNSGRVRPYTSPALEHRYLRSMAAITPKQAQDFSYMPYGAREEAEKKSKTLNLGIHLQYALEQQGVWHGTLDKSIQAAQDRGLLQPGFLQQAVDQLKT